MPDPPNSDVGFVQQGQVDWVAFGKSVPPLTIDILARIQGAGVQAFTYAGLLQLTTRFNLPERGRERLWSAIERLCVFNGASNLLYFGFGHRSFFRSMTETVSGLKAIAICACLSEVHSETMAARMLSALWKEYKCPEDIEPSHAQLRAIIKVCAGSLATSPFSEIVNRILGPLPEFSTNTRCADPIDFAKALHGLFDVSLGVKSSITVVGGPSCGIIAAMGYWLFNLDTYVEDRNGKVLFTSSATGRPVQPMSAQIHIKYFGPEQTPGVVVSESTYVLNEPKDLLVSVMDTRLLYLCRRVPWDSCLRLTFKESLTKLLSMKTALGQFFGSVARLFQALALSEANVGDHDREAFLNFTEASYGSGFVASVGDIFPELALPTLRREMESVLIKSFEQAEEQFKEAIISLKRSCTCSHCGEDRHGDPKVCLVALVFTLMDLISTISAVEFASDLRLEPTHRGLQVFYDINLRKTFDHLHRDSGSLDSKYGALLKRWQRDGEGVTMNPTSQLGSMLDDVLCLFTGHHFAGTTKPRSAVYGNGICVFLQANVSVTMRPELLRRINVIPGRISRSSARFNAVLRDYDAVLDVAMSPEPTLEEIQLEFLGTTRDTAGEEGSSGDGLVRDRQNRPASGREDLEDSLAAMTVKAEVIEPGGAGEVTFFYRISSLRGEVIVSPGRLTISALRDTGLVVCDKSMGCAGQEPQWHNDLLGQVYRVNRGWTLPRKNPPRPNLITMECYDWSFLEQSDLGRLIAYEAQDCRINPTGYSMAGMHRTILRGQACLGCCVRLSMKLQQVEIGKHGIRAPYEFHFI